MISAQTGLIVLGIVLLVVGGKKLPELGKGVGQAIANFKKGMSEPDAIDVTPKKDETAKPKEEDSSKKA